MKIKIFQVKFNPLWVLIIFLILPKLFILGYALCHIQLCVDCDFIVSGSFTSYGVDSLE